MRFGIDFFTNRSGVILFQFWVVENYMKLVMLITSLLKNDFRPLSLLSDHIWPRIKESTPPKFISRLPTFFFGSKQMLDSFCRVQDRCWKIVCWVLPLVGGPAIPQTSMLSLVPPPIGAPNFLLWKLAPAYRRSKFSLSVSGAHLYSRV